MSASEALNGKQFSPAVPDYVDKYRSGGIGHLSGDTTGSIVGMVPTHALARYAEHNGQQQPMIPGHDDKVINGIRQDIRNGGGIRNPLMLEYDHERGKASLGEGNHRLAAAVAEGVTHVPVRVSGRAYLPSRGSSIDAHPPIHIDPVFNTEYHPPEFHPHHFTQFR